jgi:hypothetical protein
VVQALRRLGHDVLTVSESGHADQAMPDEAVLEFARATARILVTFNRKHFIRWHQQRPDHAGIIVCTFDPDFSALAHRIHTVLSTGDEMQGYLIRINRPSL